MQLDPSTDRLLQCTSFYARLTPEQVTRLRADLVVRPFNAGNHVRRKGTVADGWLGVATGLVKIENTSADGRHTTLTNFSAGCWFGEGTLLKDEAWPFDAVAIVDSVVAFVPFQTFEWLLNSSVPFNRFLLNQLNARLAQFVERCEHLRLHDADHHVIHCLVEMVDPRLYPSIADNITLSQEELARLAGVSRSVVSRVLQRLERLGL
ncbi:MAG: Crp/Fnr family transcriptional regulator, partial [Burkholderiales bacterium]|nr:Crp/Fnr family transcriptional regulator [Burkholderiales bacterium]